MEQLTSQLATDKLQSYLDTAVQLGMQYAPKLLLAIIVLFVGMWIINRFVAGVGFALEKRKVEPTLARFLRSLLNILFKALLLISVASMIGVETTSFIAVLGAGGLAIGLALQGSLANFAGGVLVLLFRPYKVGDFIEAQGVSGSVKSIEIFNTVMNTPDNKIIIVPNGLLSNGIITNFSKEATRRVDLTLRIGYGDDIVQVRAMLLRLIGEDSRIHADPEPFVGVSSLGDSSVNLVVRVWVAVADYWPVNFELTERMKLAFDTAGISIPFPQQNVHLYAKHT